jgi:hypothetical protein
MDENPNIRDSRYFDPAVIVDIADQIVSMECQHYLIGVKNFSSALLSSVAKSAILDLWQPIIAKIECHLPSDAGLGDNYQIW